MPDGGFWSEVWKISPLLGGGLLALIGLVAYGATRLLVQRYLKELRDKLAEAQTAAREAGKLADQANRRLDALEVRGPYVQEAICFRVHKEQMAAIDRLTAAVESLCLLEKKDVDGLHGRVTNLSERVAQLEGLTKGRDGHDRP